MYPTKLRNATVTGSIEAADCARFESGRGHDLCRSFGGQGFTDSLYDRQDGLDDDDGEVRNGLNGDVFFTTSDYNWFIQDTWRLNSQLTLNLGLRYEYQKFPQPGETSVKGSKFTGNPAYPATVTFPQDKNNWGPRVGINYDINGSHTTVIRAGWGIYYGRSSNSVISSALTNNARHVRYL